MASKGSGISPLAAESPLQDGFRRRLVAAPSLSPHEGGNLSHCDGVVHPLGVTKMATLTLHEHAL